MKLSTYIERLMERGWRREAAEEAAILAKEAGAEWDPEEPELPARVKVSETGYNLLPDRDLPRGHGFCGSEMRRVVTEAAARYNAWGELLELLDRMKWGAINVEEVARQVKAHLESERERLT